MALIQCPECKKEISDAAGNCPHCGYPIANKGEKTPKKKPNKKIILLSIVAVILLAGIVTAVVLLLNRPGETKEKEESSLPPSSVSSEEPVSSKSAIESLTSDEKMIFDALIDGIDSLYNPASARVLDVGDLLNGEKSDSFPDGIYQVMIKLSAENRLGAQVSKVYQLAIKSYDFVSSEGTTLSHRMGELKEPFIASDVNYPMGDQSVQRLNAALKEHFAALGLD